MTKQTTIPLLSGLELSVCIFVALYVWMFVAGANKVDGTVSWLVGTNEILVSSNLANQAAVNYVDEKRN